MSIKKSPLSIHGIQMNPTVGALEENTAYILQSYQAAVEDGADIVVTPEMSLAGYPLEDLVFTPDFVLTCMEQSQQLAKQTTAETALLFGSPWNRGTGKVYNAVVVAYAGVIQHLFFKTELPNYGVFDEKRHFTSADQGQHGVLNWKGHNIGIAICEDMWFPRVPALLEAQGADFIVSVNGSPFDIHKTALRENVISERVIETGLPVLYVNMWGGQDELVFDGQSFAMNPTVENVAEKVAYLGAFEEGVLRVVFDGQTLEAAPDFPYPEMTYSANALLYDALVTGLRDYVHKNGFKHVVLGLSGGIDSALVAALAVDALGAQYVTGLLMPSSFSSDHSVTDALDLAGRLGMRTMTSHIQPIVDAFKQTLKESYIKSKGLTLENLQARARGTLLMAHSNATGAMLLSTGNKSEMSVGYATLYEDMNGGFNPLKDVYKTTVFELCTWRNSEEAAEMLFKMQEEVIPQSIIDKPPSAELSPDQKDTDSLPPYEVLDALLKMMIEQHMAPRDILMEHSAFESDVVYKVFNLLKGAEHKRRQACPGLKVTPTSFGKDWRMPITNRWNGAGVIPSND